MKTRFLVPFVTTLALAAPAVVAQPAGGMGGGMGSQHMSNTQQMNQRFERMNAMMGQMLDQQNMMMQPQGK